MSVVASARGCHLRHGERHDDDDEGGEGEEKEEELDAALAQIARPEQR